MSNNHTQDWWLCIWKDTLQRISGNSVSCVLGSGMDVLLLSSIQNSSSDLESLWLYCLLWQWDSSKQCLNFCSPAIVLPVFVQWIKSFKLVTAWMSDKTKVFMIALSAGSVRLSKLLFYWIMIPGWSVQSSICVTCCYLLFKIILKMSPRYHTYLQDCLIQSRLRLWGQFLFFLKTSSFWKEPIFLWRSILQAWEVPARARLTLQDAN